MRNKSILVIDTPNNCNQCCCGYDSYGEINLCAITNKSVTEYYYGGKRPDWCPLRELPEKANHPDLCDGGRYDKGYNACIDELLKGEEG